MTHDELRDLIDKYDAAGMVNEPAVKALRAVIELHPETADGYCAWCYMCNYDRTGLSMDAELYRYPCPTIQAIEKELR